MGSKNDETSSANKLFSDLNTSQQWAIFRFFDKCDNEILDLKRCCPELPELPRSLQSIKTIFFLLSSPPRFSPEQRAILDATLADLGEQDYVHKLGRGWA